MSKNNTGKYNSGDRNSGDGNSGYGNSGDGNSGYGNSGNWNSGYGNSGDWNSGNRNSGNRNSGNWNSGNWNSGYFNTDRPKVRIFNQETDLGWDDIEFPGYFYFDLTAWIRAEGMTDVEKREHPLWETTKGYLKTYSYQEAWRRAWDKATDEDRRKTLSLPNWNNDIFKEITGIDVEAELNESDAIMIDGKKYSKETIKEALREYVK